MGKFLKSVDLTRTIVPDPSDITPKRAKNLDQMAFILSKTSTVLKGKTHMKTPSINDIPPVHFQNSSPFV